jgi:maltooligosyltrehalose synthase
VPLPEGAWRDVLTGWRYAGVTGLAGLMEQLPVALLTRD